jgi:hypothetical protein
MGQTGPPCWVPEDVNNDGIVNLLDLVIVTGGSPDSYVTNETSFKTVICEGYPYICGVPNPIRVTIGCDGWITLNVSAYYNGSAIPIHEQWPTYAQSEELWSLGDVDRDGYIDDYDGCLIQGAFGTVPGNPNWNPDADLDKNNEVNSADLTIWTYNYGADAWTHFGLSHAIGSKTAVPFTSQTSRTIVFRWNTTGLPKNTYTLSAYVEPIEGETNTANNNLNDGTIKIATQGNVDGNNIVNMLDLYYLALDFGNRTGYVTYVPNYDINGDSWINMLDMYIAAIHFGQTDP